MSTSVGRGYFPFSGGAGGVCDPGATCPPPSTLSSPWPSSVLLVPLFRWAPRRWSPSVLLPISLGITWLSALYCNEILALLDPGCTLCLQRPAVYHLSGVLCGGCCAGLNYPRFLELLDPEPSLLTACACFFAGADLFFSWKFFVSGQSVPFLEMIHTPVPAHRHPRPVRRSGAPSVHLPPLAWRMDRASFSGSICTHSLVITWFNDLAWRLGIGRVSVQFLLRGGHRLLPHLFRRYVLSGGCFLRCGVPSPSNFKI